MVERNGLYAAGFLSYEAAAAFDSSLAVRADSSGFPLLWFGLYEQAQEIELPLVQGDIAQPELVWRPSISRSEYARGFARIKEHIKAGDSYQVNYTHRLRTEHGGDPWVFFTRLIAAQRQTLGAYLDLGRWVIASASPELYFRLDGAQIESRPMKGTAARELTWDQDREQAELLRKSEKERAENVMIVDMVRNDLGRIAQPGSVEAPRLFAVEKYPTVWQMTSTVRAQTEASLTEILRASFPPASITGAPKQRTMEIIAELESTPRRIYTGAIGLVAPGRKAQFNVAIRTLLFDRESGEAEYGVGGGIVWDSECDREQVECKTKALVLRSEAPEFELLESILWTPDSGYHDLERHLKRMEQSAQYFEYRFDRETILLRLDTLAVTLHTASHKVRVLVDSSGEIRCEAQPLTSLAAEQQPRVALARKPIDRSNKFLYHKTTNRRAYEDALAARPGVDDVILFNEAGEVTESTIANVVVELDGQLYTPPVECGLLAGTARARLLARCVLQERIITVEQLQSCRQVFLLNSVRGLWEIGLVDIAVAAKMITLAQNSGT